MRMEWKLECCYFRGILFNLKEKNCKRPQNVKRNSVSNGIISQLKVEEEQVFFLRKEEGEKN